MRAVAVEPVIKKLGRRLHGPCTMEVDGVVSGKHGLSTEAGAGAVVVETAVQQFGLRSKREVRERHYKCWSVWGSKGVIILY